MNADSDNIRDSLVDQLSSFETGLDEKADEVQMLAEIQEGIGRLLGSDGASEAEIRRVLQERYEAGSLRKETFQLVKSMLDKYVTEVVATSPSIADAAAVLEGNKVKKSQPQPQPAPVPPAQEPQDDSMSSTMVLPTDDTIRRPDPDGPVQVGSVLRDRFMLQERVSGGSMGVVYKAMDRRLAEAGTGEPWVAVKVLAPQLSQNGKALRALQQEAAKGRSLIHPNIVRFIDLDRDDELYFIVMEWLEGRTLADILDSPDAKGIDVERVFRIVRQVGKALEYAHKCGIVHADVKPANIMMAPNGDAKIFDFGVARVRQEQIGQEQDFDPGVLGLLTPAYSSMQVLTGETPVPSDDVFSLACLMYRLIAGFRVFGPRNAAEAAEEGMKPQRLQDLSDAQWRVLKKALSYSRVARFESMSDFIEALDVEEADSITVDIPAPTRFSDAEVTTGSSRWFIGFVVLLALGVVTANQLGYLDEFKATYLDADEGPAIVEGPAIEESVIELPAIEESVVDIPANDEPASGVEEQAGITDEPPAVVDEPVLDAPVDDLPGEATAQEELEPESESGLQSEPGPQSEARAEAQELIEALEIPEPEDFATPLVDFSTLPPPTAVISVGLGGEFPNSVTVTLREGGRNVTVDLVRDEIEFPRTLRLEEVSYSGNRPPWVSGQFTFSDNGFVEFPVGQNRARVTLTMASDMLREADQQSTLRVRESDTPDSSLATINVVLEDDDQRAFERTLPANTVAFATSQVSVNEQDPAVQLDILRFNPDDTPLVIGYSLRDITATQGEDYFAPGGYTIEFGPGQRSTRLLIPLVQDSAYEDNEAFSVELSTADSTADNDIYRRVAVMIRDDDQ
jgi:serine/threonine protein kinase